MNGQEAQGLDIFASLRSAMGKECPECGELNPGNATICEVCQAQLPVQEDEEESLSIVHDDGLLTAGPSEDSLLFEMSKIPMENSRSMSFLNKTIERVRNATITFEEYQKNLMEILSDAQKGMDIYKDWYSLPNITKEQKKTFSGMSSLFREFHNGCKKMLEYDGGTDGTSMVQGFELINWAILEIEKKHDKTMKMAEEIKKTN